MTLADILPSPARMRVICARDTASEIMLAQARIAAENAFISELELEGRFRHETERQLEAAGMTVATATITELMRFRTAAEAAVAAEISTSEARIKIERLFIEAGKVTHYQYAKARMTAEAVVEAEDIVEKAQSRIAAKRSSPSS